MLGGMGDRPRWGPPRTVPGRSMSWQLGNLGYCPAGGCPYELSPQLFHRKQKFELRSISESSAILNSAVLLFIKVYESIIEPPQSFNFEV